MVGLGTYAADDLVMIREMGLAILATIDALRIKIHIVGQAHLCYRPGLAYGVCLSGECVAVYEQLQAGTRFGPWIDS